MGTTLAPALCIVQLHLNLIASLAATIPSAAAIITTVLTTTPVSYSMFLCILGWQHPFPHQGVKAFSFLL